MLRHRNIDRVCCVILALTLLVSTLFVGAAATGRIAEDTTIGYETRLFDQSSMHTIDIIIDDWDAFLDTATSEEYAACHLVIDGELFRNVAIRGKGNTSLSSVATYGNDRYSFKVEFDHYQTGSTYHGLDKLSLNNLIQDNTCMKDYFAYTLMNRMGVAAPLCSFMQINVNGEPWGLYLAVEGVEDAFLQRNYGKDYGELYKPDSLSFGGGRGNGRDFDMGEMAENFGFSFGGDDGDGSGAQGFSMPDMGGFMGMGAMPEGFDPSQLPGNIPGAAETATATPEPTATAAPTAPAGGMMPDMGSFPAMNGGEMPAGFDPGQMTGGFSGMPGSGSLPEGFDPSQMAGGEFEMPDMSFGGFGGFASSTDVKLQYTDDNPSSYANIFNNAKTDITTADQKRLIASLKALNEGDVSVVDTDAVIRYMAVHNFLCNDDSYTGMMVHNYYLFEEDGVLSMIPWDYNLAYGGFSGGSNGTSTVNTDIHRLVSMGSDSDRPMAGWITSSEEYMAQYDAVYQEFITTTFDNGWFAQEIDRVTAMISPYVEADSRAFCTYEEFLTAAQTLKTFCLKRAESVANQLAGDDTRVDASDLDLSVMGTMGGMGGGGFQMPGADAGRPDSRTGATATSAEGDTSAAAPEGDAAAFSAGKGAPERSGQTGPEDGAAEGDSGRGSHRTFTGQFDMSGLSGMTTRQPAAEGWIWLAVCVVVLCGALVFVKCSKSNR